jgi:hypothetical protein
MINDTCVEQLNIEINGQMTADVILKSIKDLKTEKACGDDNIINGNLALTSECFKI